MKKFASAMLTTALVATLISPCANAETSLNGVIDFKDIDSVPWAMEAINNLVQKGIIHGMGNNLFVPSSGVTREQFAAMINSNFGLEQPSEGTSFQDVQNDRWSYTSIEKAAPYMDYFKSFSEGYMFRPTQEMKRVDVAITLVKLFIKEGLVTLPSVEQTNTILTQYRDTDDIADVAKPYFAQAVSIGLVKGLGDGLLAPNDPVTRAQAVVFLDRIDRDLLVVPTVKPNENSVVQTPAAQTPVAQTPVIQSTVTEITTNNSNQVTNNSVTQSTYGNSILNQSNPLTLNLSSAEPGEYQTVWSIKEDPINLDQLKRSGNLLVGIHSGTNGTIFAYDMQTGQMVWEYGRNSSWYPQTLGQRLVAVDDSTVVFTQGVGRDIEALSASSGEPIWNSELGSPVVDMKIKNGQAFVLTGGKLYSFDTQTGKLIWSASTDVFNSGDVATALGVGDGGVAVGTRDGRLYTFSSDGKGIDNSKFTSYSIRTIFPYQGGDWIVMYDRCASLFGTGVGDIYWTYTFKNTSIGAFYRFSTVDAASQTLYTITLDSVMTAVDLRSGQLLKSNLIDFGFTGIPVVSDGNIYVPSARGGNLNIIEGTTLQSLQMVSPNEMDNQQKLTWWSTPIIYNGFISGVTQDGQIVTVKKKS